MSSVQPIPQFVSTQPGNRSGIYVILCSISGKVYVGSSANMGRRWTSHRRLLLQNRSPHRHLQNAWNKYGEDAFSFGVLEFCSEADLLCREKLHLDLLSAYKPKYGYNTRIIPNSPLGLKHSEEARARISAALNNPAVKERHRAAVKAAANRPDVKARHSAAVNRPEFKIKHSEAVKKAWNRPGAKSKRSALMREIWDRPGQKTKRLDAIKETNTRSDVKARRSAAIKESHSRPETKARISTAVKEAWNRPGARAMRSAAMSETQNRPEVKAKRTATLKETLATPEAKARKSAAMKLMWQRRKAAKVVASADSPLVQRTLFD